MYKSSCPVLRNPEWAILLIVVQHEEVYLWIFPARSFSSSQLFLDIFKRYSCYETRTPSHQMEHGQLSTLRAHHWNHSCPGWSMENVPCMWVRMPVAVPWVVASCGPCQGHVGHVLVPWWIKSLSILRLLENGFPHYPNQWVEVHTPSGTSIIHTHII
jgi:hypothetical protein